MSEVPRALTEQYTTALENYLTGGGEAALVCAYELGRQAMHHGLGVLDVIGIYHEALTAAFSRTQAPPETNQIVNAALDFFTESLSPFEMVQRGFQETNALRRLNEELAQAEATIRANERQLQAFLDHSTAIIFLKDLEGRYLLINRQYELLYHITREQAVGKTDYDLYPEELATRFRDNDRKILEADSPVEVEVAAPREDGWHTYILVMFALRDDAGQPYALGGFATDITDRKRSAEEIQELNAQLTLRMGELEAVNKKLTREVAERKRAEEALQERSVQLEAANKELEAFSYSVSHDLRAPLRSIDGFSQALLEDYAETLDDQGKDYLHRVRANSQRMAQLIDDLLNLSRVTRSEMHRETVDLSALAQDIAAELHKTQPERALEWVVAEGVMAQGDARLLRIVLENLLGNAWKFTGKQAEARVEFGVTDKEGETVYFVRDNGAGFDMAYVDRLFGAFQRLHAMTEFAGTGIGLATVARIIHRHGGRVWAESAPQQGAVFFFTL